MEIGDTLTAPARPGSWGTVVTVVLGSALVGVVAALRASRMNVLAAIGVRVMGCEGTVN